MTDSPESTPWYKAAFRGEYLSLYTHRDDQEALNLASLTARVTGLPCGARVADVPCGGGRHLRAFSAMGWQVTGLDLSQDLLVAARNANGPVPPYDAGRGQEHALPPALARADIRALPLPSRQFDLVANVFTSLGYFDDDRTNATALAELARLVRPGGWLLIDFLDAAHIQATLQPHTTRTTPQGWFVDERREILPPDLAQHQAVPRVVKTVTITKPESPDQPLRHQEKVALLDRDWFQTQFEELALSTAAVHTSYSAEPLTESAPPRLILYSNA